MLPSKIIGEKGKNISLFSRFKFVAESNVLTGSTKDIYLSRFMAGLFKAPDSIYQPLLKKYNLVVDNREMKKAVTARRIEYSAPVVASDIDVSRGASINAIFEKYRGKIIYLDFWASWCIPCRSEMPNAAELKKKLNGGNIAFLYFGYKDSEVAWKKARTQLRIDGEHYLLNENTIKEADEVFGINGIPHYAIIGSDGKIIEKRADRPRNVYQQLSSLLEKASH
jgi:thiol-disulfide isomerase/thioredoxin